MGLRVNILLSLASLIFSLIGAELYLRWNPTPYVYAMTRHVVQHTHSEPITHPVLGYIPKANLIKPFRNREFDTTIRINSQNMRDQEYALEKPEGVKRIVVVGDSFIFGWGVEENQRVTEILENHYFTNVEVLNLGVSGYCSDEELEWLKFRGLAFKPDRVLFFTSDLPLSCHNQYKFVNHRLYWADSPELTWWVQMRSWLLRNIYLISFFDYSVADILQKMQSFFIKHEIVPNHFNATEKSPPWEETILEELSALTQSHGFKTVIVFFPTRQELMQPGSQSQNIPAFAKACQDKGLAFLDLTPILKDYWFRGKLPYFKYDDHWNRYGHEAAAEAILRFLMTNEWVEEIRIRRS